MYIYIYIYIYTGEVFCIEANKVKLAFTTQARGPFPAIIRIIMIMI